MRRIEQLLTKQHERAPLQAAFPPATLQKIFPADAVHLLDAVIRRMQAAERLKVMPAGVALPGSGPQLSKPQRRLYESMIETHRRAGCTPPTIQEIAATAANQRATVPKLVELAIAEGHLVRICADWCLHSEVEQEVLETLERRVGHGSFAVRDLRELLGASRKYLIPLCEHLDRIGFTHRDGNLRTLLGAPTRPVAEVRQ